MIGFGTTRHRVVNNVFKDCHQTLTRVTQTVESTRFDERFHGLLVEAIGGHAHREIVERIKGPIGLAFRNNAFTNGLTDTFDCRQAEVNNALFNLGCEVNIGHIDVGWPNGNSTGSCINQITSSLIKIVFNTGEHCGEILNRIIRFKESCLVADVSVSE